MTNKYDNYSDEQIVQEIKEIELEKDEITTKLKTVKEILYQRRKAEIDKLLKEKAEPFGIVSMMIGDSKVKVDIKKDVQWDEDKLESIYEEIRKDGENPKEYIKVSYEVSETKYKAWPENIKKYFKDARTVKPGNPSIKIEEKK